MNDYYYITLIARVLVCVHVYKTALRLLVWICKCEYAAILDRENENWHIKFYISKLLAFKLCKVSFYLILFGNFIA